MKKILVLRQIANAKQAKQTYTPFGDNSAWWIHTLSDGATIFEHWSKDQVLPSGMKERVVMRIGKKIGVPISRIVDITA